VFDNYDNFKETLKWDTSSDCEENRDLLTSVSDMEDYMTTEFFRIPYCHNYYKLDKFITPENIKWINDNAKNKITRSELENYFAEDELKLFDI
jgi:hypothetical protein